MKTVSTLTFWIISLLLPTVHAQIAILQSDRIMEGDVAILLVEYSDDTPSMYALDTSPLDKSFDVLSVKPKVERRHENNKIVNVQHWEVTLSPKLKGEIKVPSLKIKQASTPELILQVIDSTSVENVNEKIWIEVDIYPESPFIGEQTLVTIRLVSSQPILNGFLSEPRLEQANVVHLGIDQAYVETINGKPFNILQRKLALFANKAGELMFPVVQFLGEIDALNANNLPRQILRKSDPITLTILEPPSTHIGSDWLPMTELEISDQWVGLDSDLKMGDSISRTISIRATGLTSDKLPNDLFKLDGENLVVYADKTKRENIIVDGNIVGHLVQSYAVVLTGQGRLKIPEITLDWWDIDDNQQKQTALSGKTLTVAAAVVSSATDTTQSGNIFYWIAGAFGLILLFAIISKLLFNRTSYLERRFNKKQFKHACLKGEAVRSRELLIIWARGQWPEKSIVGLNDVKDQLDSSELRGTLKKLDAAIYAPNQTGWQGQQLWKEFVNLQSLIKLDQYNMQTNQQGLLPSLYPCE